MKLVLSIVAFCLAVNNGIGAPSKARYKFVKCNPEGSQSNCVTYQSPQMEWSTELPLKLSASATQYLDAEAVVKDERPPQDGESPMVADDGSGFEGSADEGPFMPDWASVTDNGSGESWTEYDDQLDKGLLGDTMISERLRAAIGEAKPAEEDLKEDHLLHL